MTKDNICYFISVLCLGGLIICMALEGFKPEIEEPIVMIATPISEPLTYQHSSSRGTGSPACVRRFFVESIGRDVVREERSLTFSPTDAPCLATGKFEIPAGYRPVKGSGYNFSPWILLCLLMGGILFFIATDTADRLLDPLNFDY